MIWSTTILVFWALFTSSIGQAQYEPYNGPPVVPVILPGGFLADTKEVAAAKEYFLNALAKTAAEVKGESPTDTYSARTYQAPQPSYQQQAISQYQGQPQPATPTFQPQPAAPALQPQPQYYTHTQPQSVPLYGQQAAYNGVLLQGGHQYIDVEYREDPQYQYSSSTPRPDPQVTPVILENGYIADTQEVNAAKANHFAAVAQAQEAVARAQERATAARYSSPQYSTGFQIADPKHPQQQG